MASCLTKQSALLPQATGTTVTPPKIPTPGFNLQPRPALTGGALLVAPHPLENPSERRCQLRPTATLPRLPCSAKPHKIQRGHQASHHALQPVKSPSAPHRIFHVVATPILHQPPILLQPPPGRISKPPCANTRKPIPTSDLHQKTN